MVLWCILMHPNFECVLMQNRNVIASAFRQLMVNEINYPIHDLELANQVFSLKFGGVTCMGFMLMFLTIIRVFNMCLPKRS